MEAFKDYKLEAVQFSRMEKEVLANLIKERGGFSLDEIVAAAKNEKIPGKVETDGTAKGELAETIEKFKKMGIIK